GRLGREDQGGERVDPPKFGEKGNFWGAHLGRVARPTPQPTPADAELASFTQPDFFECFAQDIGAKTRHGSANRNHLAFLHSAMHRSYCALGRTISVLQPSTRSPALHHISRERLAANVNKGESWKFLLRIFTAGCSKQRGRWTKKSNVLATQPRNKVRSKSRRMFVHNHQRCPCGKSKPDFFDR